MGPPAPPRCNGRGPHQSPASTRTRSTTKSPRSLTGMAGRPPPWTPGLRTTAATRNGRTGPFTIARPNRYLGAPVDKEGLALRLYVTKALFTTKLYYKIQL